MSGLNIKIAAKVSGKLFEAQAIIDAAKEGVKDSGDIIKDSFEESQSTFNHKASFDVDLQDFTVTVGTGDKPYIFVAGGTSVRYATMAPGYQPKTPPMLPPRGGGGKVAYISRKRPRPGIKARNPQKAIAKRDGPKCAEAIQKRVDAAI